MTEIVKNVWTEINHRLRSFYKITNLLSVESRTLSIYVFRVRPHSPFSRSDPIACDYVVAFGTQAQATLDDLIAVAKMSSPSQVGFA